MPGSKARYTAKGRARGAARANEVRAQKRQDIEASFRGANRLAGSNDIVLRGELTDPFDWFWQHVDGDEVSTADMTISANKLRREGKWISKDFPDLSRDPARSRPRHPDALYLARAADLIRSNEYTCIVGDPDERVARTNVKSALCGILEKLDELDKRPPMHGHNGGPMDEPEFTSDIAEINRLKASISAVQFEVEKANANLERVIAETAEMRKWATERQSVQPRAAIVEKFLDTYTTDLAHLAAVGTVGILSQILPEVFSLIHFVVLWLCVQLPEIDRRDAA